MLFLNLKNFWRGIKQDRLLLLALLFGLLLRGLNATFGSPSLYISNDEASAHLSAFNMLATKNPVSIANYTPLGAYVQIPFLIGSFLVMRMFNYVHSIADFELFVLTHEGYFLFVPRLISGLFGTLTILIVYKITKELFQAKRTAIIAAFLAAVSFNLVHISHFGRPWSASLFFMTLAVYMAIKKKVLLAYFSIALSYGFHQAGIVAIPLIFLLTRSSKGVVKYTSLLVCFLIIILLSSLTLKTGVIDSILRGQSFIRSNVLITDFLSGNFDFFDSLSRTFENNLSSYFILNLLVTDGLIVFLGIMGMVFASSRSVFSKLIIFYILSFFLLASLFFHPLIRYLLPVLILLIPYAANFLSTAFKKNIIILLILAVASVNSLWWNLLFFEKPTFISMHDWVDSNINPMIGIAYTGTRYRVFLPNNMALDHMHEADKFFYQRLESLLNSTPTDNVRNIVYINVFPGNDKATKLANAVKSYNVSYVVDYYIDPQDRLYSQMPERFEFIREFNPTRNGSIAPIPEPLFDASWNFPQNDARKKVSMYSLTNIGPYFDILKFKN